MGKHKEKEIKTNAMRILEKNKIPYETIQYECEEFIDGLHTAQKTGAPVEQSFKTLVVQGKSKEYYVLVIPIAEEIDLKKHPVLYRYVTSIQDEVHRFAIDYHRGLRKKAMEKSILDEIPGIGQNRKRALLAAFGSIENIRNADADELAAIDGMNRKAAEEVRLFFDRRKRLTERKIRR